jgi:hypothetical protein
MFHPQYLIFAILAVIGGLTLAIVTLFVAAMAAIVEICVYPVWIDLNIPAETVRVGRLLIEFCSDMAKSYLYLTVEASRSHST